jgi:hypothetical protein
VLASTAVRGAYLPPVTVTADAYSSGVFAGPQPGEDDWVLGQHYIDAAGGPIPLAEVFRDGDSCAAHECLRRAGVVAMQTDVQPVSRYWPFQLIETAILLALAACAVVVGSLRLRRSLVP